MALIKYVGRKAKKQDNVAGTGALWLGQGDVQEVPEAAVAKLLKHPDVWALADVAPNAGLAAAPAPAAAPDPVVSVEPAKFVLDGPTGVVVLDTMDDAGVKAWVAENLKPHGIEVDGRKKGDNLRKAVINAVKAATTKAEA